MSQFSKAVPRVKKISRSTSYIPYGEVFVEESAAGWQSPYYFNAKELDEETGLYYYGARYLDPTEARWMSVDPMFEKYVGMSPYNYCAGNPVKLVDPDGREFQIPDGSGNTITYIPGKTTLEMANTEFAKKTIMSLNFLYENGGEKAKGVIDKMSSSSLVARVRQFVTNNFSFDNNEITWNPTLVDVTGNGVYQSPAESLYHEVVHFYFSVLMSEDPSLFDKYMDFYDDSSWWPNSQDEIIIKEYETDVAINLGKFKPTEEHPYVRDCYQDIDRAPIEVTNPTKINNEE